MLVSIPLAAHLELFTRVYVDVEHHVDMHRGDIDHYNQYKKLPRSENDVKADAKIVEKGLTLAAKHAECAERLLSLLVLSRWRLLHRMRMVIKSLKEERDCQNLLKTGEL